MTAQIRASYTKLALKYLKQGNAQDWDALRAQIGDAPLAEIRAAGPIAWLPATTHAAVADATIALYGAYEARVVWRDVMLAGFERSMLRPLVGGALRLYGEKPSSILRMTPQGWSLAFKDCGRAWMEDRTEDPAYEQGPQADGHALICFEDLPHAISMSDGLIESFVANCDAALAYVKCRGQVNADRTSLGRGVLRIEVSWTGKRDSTRPPAATLEDDGDDIDMR